MRFTEMESYVLVFHVGRIPVGALPTPPQCGGGSTGRFQRSGSGVLGSRVDAIDGVTNRHRKNVDLLCDSVTVNCGFAFDSTHTCSLLRLLNLWRADVLPSLCLWGTW